MSLRHNHTHRPDAEHVATGPGVVGRLSSGMGPVSTITKTQLLAWLEVTGGDGPVWGGITGTLANQSDLQTALNGKAASAHNHDAAYAALNHNHAALYSPLAHDHDVTALSGFPGGTANFLRADGTFAEPPAGSGGSDPFVFKNRLAADITTGANVTPVNITGWVFSIEADSTYFVEVAGFLQAAATTTGAGIQIDVSVAVADVGLAFVHQLANTGTLTGGSAIADGANAGVSSGLPAANTKVPFFGQGLIVTGGSPGIAQMRLRSEVSAAVSLKANSLIRVHKF